MDHREISEEYSQIMKEVLEENKELEILKHADLNIIALSSTHRKKSHGKKVFGQCEKVQDKYKWGIPCDFTITIFEPNCFGFTHDQLKILMFHELLHIGIDDGKPFIKPHDLEDFKLIIDKYGTNWAAVDEERLMGDE